LRGVALPEDVVAQTLAYVDGLPADATASMQRDIMEGRPSELEAQTGTIVGRVTDTRSGVPVTTAQVTVTGTSLGAVVDAEGRFRIANVPPGTYEVRARSIGYQPATATVTATADASRQIPSEVRMDPRRSG